jgi:hypothetical protein
MTTEERDARLILASLTTPRGVGRAALLKLAEKGDDTALDVLEMTPRQREIALVRGALSPKVTSLFATNPVYQAAVAKKRERSQYNRHWAPKATSLDPAIVAWNKRFYSRSLPTSSWFREDPLKSRAPGQTVERFVLDIFEKSLRRAGFRGASGGTKTVTTFVSPGQAGVKVEHGSVRKKKGSGWWSLTVTRHWRVSSEILKVPQARDDGSRFDGKHLWLAPDIRVRQGRGVDLVVERRHGGKWEVSKSSGDWVEGQGWKANWQ